MNKQSGAVAIVLGVLTATLATFALLATYLFVVPLVLGTVCTILGVVAFRTDGMVRRHVDRLAAGLVFVAVGLPIGLIEYNHLPGYPIVVVVPDGFRGPVRLVIDREQGVDVPLDDGRYSYRVPDDGTLLIRDDKPFRQSHSEMAMYRSGKAIPIEYGEDRPPDAVSLHLLGAGSWTRGGKQEEGFWYFVGTKAEKRKYVDK